MDPVYSFEVDFVKASPGNCGCITHRGTFSKNSIPVRAVASRSGVWAIPGLGLPVVRLLQGASAHLRSASRTHLRERRTRAVGAQHES